MKAISCKAKAPTAAGSGKAPTLLAASDGLVRLEIADFCFLVHAHERAVARNVGLENRGQRAEKSLHFKISDIRWGPVRLPGRRLPQHQFGPAGGPSATVCYRAGLAGTAGRCQAEGIGQATAPISDSTETAYFCPAMVSVIAKDLIWLVLALVAIFASMTAVSSMFNLAEEQVHWLDAALGCAIALAVLLRSWWKDRDQ